MSGETNDVMAAIKGLPEEDQKAIMEAWNAAYTPAEEEEQYQRPVDATFYAEDYPPAPERPGMWTETKASVRDIAQGIGLADENVQSDAQKEMADWKAKQEANMADREAIYQYTGRPAEIGGVELGGIRVQEGKIANPDFDPTQPESEANPAYKYQKMYVPAPDTNMATRMIGELATRTVEAIGDLVIDQNVLKEGTASAFLPNSPQGSGEALATEITSYLIPGLGARKAAVGTVKAADSVIDLAKRIDPKYVQQAKEAFENSVKNGASITEAGSKAKGIITTGLAGVYAALGETMIAPEGSKGIVVSPEIVAEMTGMDEDNAKATALFLDSAGFGAALAGLTKAVGMGKDFVKTKAGGLTRFNKGITKDMYEGVNSMYILKSLDPELMEGPSEVVAMRLRILAEEVGTNKVVDILEGTGKEGVQVRLDSTNALIQSTRNYLRRAYAYKVSELGQEGFDAWADKKAAEMANNMVYLRSTQAANPGVIQSEAVMLNDIGAGLEGMVDRQVAEAGIDSVEAGAVATAGDLAQDRATAMAKAKTTMNAIDQELAYLEELKATGLMQDSQLGPLLAKFEGAGDVGMTKQLTDRLKALMGDDVYNAWKKDFDAVNTTYKNFPAGAPIDAKGMALALREATDALNMIDTSGREAKNLLGRIATAFKLPKAVAKDIEGDKAEAFFAKLEEKVSGPNGIDTKYLYTVVKPEIEALIQSAEGETRNRLIAFKKWITEDQLEYLATTGSKQVAEYARNADRTFRSYANRWKPDTTMPMGQLDEAARSRAMAEQRYAKTGDEDVLAQGREEYATVAGRTVESMSSDLSGAGFEPVIRAVKGSVDADIAPEFADYYASLALKSLSDSIASGSPQNLRTLNSALTAYLPKLEALNSPLVPKIRQAQTNLQMLESGVADATQAATEARALAEQAYKEAENSIVAKLVSDVGITVPRSDADNVIAGIFKGPDSVNQMNALMGKVSQLPPAEAEAGLAAIKAVALRTATEKVFTYARGGVTALDDAVGAGITSELRTANRASIKTADDILAAETDKTLSTLKTVFADDPMTVQVYTDLLRALDTVTVPSTVKVNAVGSDTAALSQMASAADSSRTAIILAFGVLNPTATMARNLSRGVTDALDEAAKQIDKDVMAQLMAEPQAIVEAARKLADGVDPEVVRQTLTSRLNRYSQSGFKATTLGVEREPERTEKQDAVTSPESYRMYLDEQMRQLIPQ